MRGHLRSTRRRKQQRPSSRKKLIAWLVYLSIFVLVGAILVWLRGILLPFVIALLIAFIFEPLVTRLQSVGMARWIGVIIVYAALIGLGGLFVRFLVPIIDVESKKIADKFNVVLQEAPRMYDSLESGVTNLIDRLAVNDSESEMPVVSTAGESNDWGFGPPVHRTPTVQPPAVPHIPTITFGADDKTRVETGLPEQPDWDGDTDASNDPKLKERKETNHLLVHQLEPGMFGVNFGKAAFEVRKTSDDTYVVGSREDALEASRWGDLKTQAITSMRKGLKQMSGGLLEGFFKFFQGLVSGIMAVLIGLVVVFLVGGFALIDAPMLIKAARDKVPRRYRTDFDEFLERLNSGLSGVVRGQLLICLVNGFLSTVGFLIFIPEYAVVLGVLAGLLSIIPIFGTIISSVPAVLVAMTISFGHALGVLAWILGIHFVEAYLLNPKIIGSQAKIHPILVVFVLIAGETMYGMKGILLAVPVTSVVQTIIQFAYSRIRRYVL